MLFMQIDSCHVSTLQYEFILEFQSYIFSSKDDLKMYSSQLYACVVCHHPDKELLCEAVEEFSGKITHKVTTLI